MYTLITYENVSMLNYYNSTFLSRKPLKGLRDAN